MINNTIKHGAIDYIDGNCSAELVQESNMYKRGDCIRVWVNEGEFLNLGLQLLGLLADRERLEFICRAERTVATCKYVIQVLGVDAEAHMAYFENPKPDKPMTQVLHASKLDALKHAINEAILYEKAKTIK